MEMIYSYTTHQSKVNSLCNSTKMFNNSKSHHRTSKHMPVKVINQILGLTAAGWKVQKSIKEAELLSPKKYHATRFTLCATLI